MNEILKNKTFHTFHIAIAVLVVLAAGGWFAWRWLAPPGLPAGILEGYGRIEGTEVTVASKVAGRIVKLAVAEGDRVKPGMLIAELSAEDIKARLEEAGARVATLEHHAATAREDYRRAQALFQDGAISAQQRDRAGDALRQAEGELAAARAAHAEAQTAVTEMRIVAPIAGTIVTKAAQEGELVFPGRPVVVLVDLTRPYLRVYIPERDIGKVKLGDPARVYVDSFPKQPFEAVVTEVAKQAEFTPKDVHMPDERVTLVYGVKLEISNPQGLLKPGMPADALIRWKPAVEWGR